MIEVEASSISGRLPLRRCGQFARLLEALVDLFRVGAPSNTSRTFTMIAFVQAEQMTMSGAASSGVCNSTDERLLVGSRTETFSNRHSDSQAKPGVCLSSKLSRMEPQRDDGLECQIGRLGARSPDAPRASPSQGASRQTRRDGLSLQILSLSLSPSLGGNLPLDYFHALQHTYKPSCFTLRA